MDEWGVCGEKRESVDCGLWREVWSELVSTTSVATARILRPYLPRAIAAILALDHFRHE